MVDNTTPQTEGPPLRPSVGRIVHFQSPGTPDGEYPSEVCAAIVTAVYDGIEDNPRGRPYIGLCVLRPNAMTFSPFVPYAKEPTVGHWNWPPRTDV